MATRVPDRYFPHRNLIAYKPKAGSGAYGPVTAALVVAERGIISEKRKLVRDQDGNEAVSEAQVALDFPDHDVPLGSLVTIWYGTPRARESKVIAVSIGYVDRLPGLIELALE